MTKAQNKVFFTLLHQIFSEQENVDWAFKTSIIDISGLSQVLGQNALLDTTDKNAYFRDFINETKPYHSKISVLTEEYNTTDDIGNIEATDTLSQEVTINFDRISITPELGGYDCGGYDSINYDTTVNDITTNMNNAANRIYTYYDSSSAYQLNISEILGCDFKSYTINGADFDSTNIGYDNDYYFSKGYDGPTFEAYYYITDGNVAPFELGQEDDTTVRAIKSIGSTIFELPTTNYHTNKVEVYITNNDIRTNITDFTVINNCVVLTSAPLENSIVFIAVLDFNYIYDKIYSSTGFQDISEMDYIFNGDGLLRPKWERNRPEELSRVLTYEDIQITVETNDKNIYNITSGYDDTPFDSMPYDTNFTGTTDYIATTISQLHINNNEVFNNQLELPQLPQSNESIWVFNDRLYTNNYTLNWADIKTDTHITNPTINIIPSNYVDIITFKDGGGRVEERIIKYNNSDISHIIESIVTDVSYIVITVDGNYVDFTLNDKTITLSTQPTNSTVIITVYSSVSDVFNRVYKQNSSNTSTITLQHYNLTVPMNYQAIHVFDTTGKLLTPQYHKRYVVNDATVSYKTFAPSNYVGDYTVYVDGTPTTQYSMIDNTITFLGTMVLGTVIDIYTHNLTNDYYITNNILTLATSSNVDIYTYKNQISTKLITEVFNTVESTIPLSTPITDDKLLGVFIDGLFQHKGVDYFINDDKLILPTNEDERVVQVIYELETKGSEPSTFIIKKQGNEWVQHTINDKHITTLANDLTPNSNSIILSDVTVITPPYKHRNPKNSIPGQILINNDIIKFWSIDYTTNTISDLEMDSSVTHYSGETVIDYHNKYKTPYVLPKVNKITHNLDSNFDTWYHIRGTIHNIDDIRVDYIPATKLYSDLTSNDTTINVNDSSVLNLPDNTIIDNGNNYIGELTIGDIINFTIEGETFPIIITSIDWEDLVTTINTNLTAIKYGVSSEIVTITTNYTTSYHTLRFSVKNGLSLVLGNALGYPLQDLFGATILGNNSSVTVDGYNGISINGTDVIFTGTTTLDIVNDINNADIQYIMAQVKNNKLQIINTAGSGIEINNLTSLDNLSILGLSNTSGNSVFIYNDSKVTINGILPTKHGEVWLNEIKYFFKKVDTYTNVYDVLKDIYTNDVDVELTTKSTGMVIQGSTIKRLTKGVDYIYSNKAIKLTFTPNVGGLLRIIN